MEKSLLGWREYEQELLKDRSGTAVVVCGIENLDPMGVHTGDSIAVSPIQTLRDKEYKAMRKMVFAVLDALSLSSIDFSKHIWQLPESLFLTHCGETRDSSTRICGNRKSCAQMYRCS